MQIFVEYIYWAVLIAHVAMVIVAAFYAWRGENGVVRLSGLDLASTLTTAVLAIIGIVTKSEFFIDVAIVTAALGYLATVVIAKFISDQRVF